MVFSPDGKVIASGSDLVPLLLLRPTPELTGGEKVSDMDESNGESVYISV